MLLSVGVALVRTSVKIERHIAVLQTYGVISIAQVLHVPLVVGRIVKRPQVYIAAGRRCTCRLNNTVPEVRGQMYLIVTIRYRLLSVDSYEEPLLGVALVAAISLDIGAIGDYTVFYIHIKAVVVDYIESTLAGFFEYPILDIRPVYGILLDIGPRSRSGPIKVQILTGVYSLNVIMVTGKGYIKLLLLCPGVFPNVHVCLVGGRPSGYVKAVCRIVVTCNTVSSVGKVLLFLCNGRCGVTCVSGHVVRRHVPVTGHAGQHRILIVAATLALVSIGQGTAAEVSGT